jgi:type I restriction enzyme R subunit
VNKKDLSERDICTKFITPAMTKAGWDVVTQVRENVHLTKGRVIVRGKARHPRHRKVRRLRPLLPATTSTSSSAAPIR